jgi:CubicO group peptidase (beta-lactamase class C family)
MHSPLFTLFGVCKPRTEVTGFVKEGYESARDEFEKLMNEGMEENAQACAYVNGELVLDLVGVVDSRRETTSTQQACTYDASSLQNVFSSSKAVASIAVAMLVDRGHLQYDMKIADIWPGEASDRMLIIISALMIYTYTSFLTDLLSGFL